MINLLKDKTEELKNKISMKKSELMKLYYKEYESDNQELLADNCFIHACKQVIDDIDDINKLRTRFTIDNRYLSQKHLNKVVTENNIHLVIDNYDEGYSKTHPVHKVRQTVRDEHGKEIVLNYLGVPKNKAKYHIKMCLYKNHYFIDQTVPEITINHLRQMKDWTIEDFKDKIGKVYTKAQNGNITGERMKNIRHLFQHQNL